MVETTCSLCPFAMVDTAWCHNGRGHRKRVECLSFWLSGFWGSMGFVFWCKGSVRHCKAFVYVCMLRYYSRWVNGKLQWRYSSLHVTSHPCICWRSQTTAESAIIGQCTAGSVARDCSQFLKQRATIENKKTLDKWQALLRSRRTWPS